MAKDLGGFMKSFAGNLGGQMAGLGGENNPAPDPFQMMSGMFGGDDSNNEELNPGQKMFGMDDNNQKKKGFFQKFGSNISDQLFQRAMMGFMGRGY